MHIPFAVLQMCQELSEMSMFGAFGKRPFPWQRAIITHLNLMTCPTSGIAPLCTFLCAPTVEGKSIARDSFAAGQGRVSWCCLLTAPSSGVSSSPPLQSSSSPLSNPSLSSVSPSPPVSAPSIEPSLLLGRQALHLCRSVLR